MLPTGWVFWGIVLLMLAIGIVLLVNAFYRFGVVLIVASFVGMSISGDIIGKIIRASAGAFIVGVGAFFSSGFHYWVHHV